MIQSMTGFGKATGELKKRKVTVEIKSLNSKQLDLSVRMPNIYKEHEMSLRNMLAKKLERGKVDFLIYVENVANESTSRLNNDALASYKKQICESASVLGVDTPTDWFQILMRLPDVLTHEQQEAEECEWDEVLKIVSKGVEQLIQFREQEGAMLQQVFEEKIANISSYRIEIEQYESERVEKVKTRVYDALQKLEDFDYDKNRFEQEMIYHIEKLDINEEKTRLDNHLSYFVDTMKEKAGQGKKLGFITQEMGREINTLGSKSNHVEMQQIVVRMKDELEQIKEQVLNVL